MKPKATIREMLAELRKDNEWVERRYLRRLPASATSMPHNKVVVHNRTDEIAPYPPLLGAISRRPTRSLPMPLYAPPWRALPREGCVG
jgi:hypothetical protein